MQLSISIPNIYLRVGKVVYPYVCHAGLNPDPSFEPSRYALMFYWPRRQSVWLRLAAAHGDNFTQPFRSTPEAIQEVCMQHAIPPDRFPRSFLESHAVLVASVARNSPIRLEFTIDTDDESLRRAVEERGDPRRGEFVLNGEEGIAVYALDGRHLGVLDDRLGQVTLVLTPARPVGPYEGFGGLDLGNTASTLVCLSLTEGGERTEAIRVLNAERLRGELHPHTEPVPSQVNILRIRTGLREEGEAASGIRRFPCYPKDDYPMAVEWTVGRVGGAGPSNTSGLVLGAKRLVAGRDWENVQRIVAAHRVVRNVGNVRKAEERSEQIEVVNRLPAELLVCRLLQRFREANTAWPRHLALTYPTTYSPRELEQLRNVVQRGWLRMQVRPQRMDAPTEGQDAELNECCQRLQYLIESPPGAEGVSEDPVIGLLLDEASAAAFFFLYRKIFESPGGLRWFHYNYPRGLNLLLYDCGGGTTDIALVSARTIAESPDLLKITVRARSGLRSFGGDNVTEAVCRILKAKIALKLADVRRPPGSKPPAFPAAGGAAAGDAERQRKQHQTLNEYLNNLDHARFFDRMVPTFFKADRLDDDTRQRREHTFELWRWGELVKSGLERGASTKFITLDRNRDPLSRALLLGLGDVEARNVVQQMAGIEIHRWEVDALVRPAIQQSITNCNNLIHDVLADKREGARGEEDGENHAGPEEVHWVVASGNGSRYPLIQELLRKQLHIPFLDDGRFELDERNLKHAVAKGAVLALATMRAMLGVGIEFDSDLSNRLPYTVAYQNLTTGDHPPLFREHQRYDRLQAQTVPIATLRRPANAGQMPDRPRLFVLERRFPGDPGYTPFLQFTFADGIQGDLEIAYDKEKREFTVRDTNTNVSGEYRELSDGRMYRSPVQRGNLCEPDHFA